MNKARMRNSQQRYRMNMSNYLRNEKFTHYLQLSLLTTLIRMKNETRLVDQIYQNRIWT